MQLLKTFEFESWLKEKSAKTRSLIESRLFRIEHYSHFGDAKYLGDRLAELRWKNGLRVYFAKISANTIVVILGGQKNGQSKDIKEARILLQGHADWDA